MPIYDFECTSCGFADELMRKISEPSTATCPSCKKETFSKKLSAPSFQLNGTGWYATDFKGGSSAKNVAANSAETQSTSDSTASASACAANCACH